jgi:hypothetical protein
MNDNNKGPNDPNEHEEEFGEEFDFDSGAQGDVLEPEEVELAEPVQTQRKGTLLPLIIGIGIIGGIGYFAYDKFLAPKNKIVATQKAKVETKTTTQAKAETMPTTIEPEPTPGKVDGGLQGALLDTQSHSLEQKAAEVVKNEMINKLQKQVDDQDAAYKKEIAELHKNIQEANQQATNANKNVQALQQQVASLSTALQTLTAEVKGVREDQAQAIAKAEEQAKAAKVAKAQPAKAQPKTEVAGNPNVTIHAIIPGRAWIRTADGKTITVSEGDSVGEYGKVLKIDAANGVVVTTSGVTIR